MTLHLLDQLADRALIGTPIAREIRLRAGTTQQRCAEALGVNRITFARWERGKQRPRDAHADAYVALLKRLVEVAR